MTKRLVVLAVGGPLAVLLAALGQVWASGSSQDPVLGRAALSITGTQMVPAALGLALVVGAALVAMLTGGPRIRTAAGVLMALAALAVVGLIGASAGRGVGRPHGFPGPGDERARAVGVDRRHGRRTHRRGLDRGDLLGASMGRPVRTVRSRRRRRRDRSWGSAQRLGRPHRRTRPHPRGQWPGDLTQWRTGNP